MPHTRPWDENAPAGATTPASSIDDIIRQLKVDLRERLVDAGLTNFATDDPVGFTELLFKSAQGKVKLAPGGEFRVTRSNGDALLVVDDFTTAYFGGNVQVAASLVAAIASVIGLINAYGGITVAANQPTLLQGPVTITKNTTLNGGQAVITPVQVAAAGAAQTIDWNTGNNRQLVLTANLTLTFTNPALGGVYILKFTQDGTGGRTVTWPANVRWPSNIAIAVTPTINKSDTFVLYYDGVNYLANVAGYDYDP